MHPHEIYRDTAFDGPQEEADYWPTLVGPGIEHTVDNYHGMVRTLQEEYGLLGNQETSAEYAKQIEAGLFADKLLELVDDRTSEEDRTALYDHLLDEYGKGLAQDAPEDEPDAAAVKDRFDDMLTKFLGTQESQDALADISELGDKARTALTLGSLGLALSVAYRTDPDSRQHARFADTISEANVGLMRSIDTYDYTKGAFSTYAFNGIQMHLARTIPDLKNSIYIPSYMRAAVSASISEANRHAAPQASESEVTRMVQETLNQKLAANRTLPVNLSDLPGVAGNTVASLESPIGENGTTLGDLLAEIKPDDDPNKGLYVPDDNEVNDDTLYVRGLLTERQLQIVRLRYGSAMTLAQIGEEVGSSRQAVDQTLKAAFKKVAKAYEPENVEDL